MGLKKRCAVLFSGGWDSVFCAIAARKKYGDDVCCFFFDYGQSYRLHEKNAVSRIAPMLKLKLVICQADQISIDDKGVFDNRNEVLLAELMKRSGASVVYFGCRNPLRYFDRFGDSNWQWTRRMSKKYDVKIETPCVLRPKFWIRRKVIGFGVPVKYIYSTEV